jgi:Ni/Co efflux regulator RcnB
MDFLPLPNASRDVFWVRLGASSVLTSLLLQCMSTIWSRTDEKPNPNESTTPTDAGQNLLKRVAKPEKPTDTGIRRSIFIAALVGGSVATSIGYFGATSEILLGLFTFTCVAAIWFATWLYRSREARAEYRAWRKGQMTPDQVRKWQTAKVTSLAVLALYLLGVAIAIIALS